MTKQRKAVYGEDMKWLLDNNTLTEVLQIINNLIVQYGSDATIDVCGDGLDLTYYREETDQEYEHRLSLESQMAQIAEARERAQYETLKAKFEV